MFEEEARPRKKSGFEPLKLVDMSIGEMEDYIKELEGEIERVKSDIMKKKASIAAASSIFKT